MIAYVPPIEAGYTLCMRNIIYLYIKYSIYFTGTLLRNQIQYVYIQLLNRFYLILLCFAVCQQLQFLHCCGSYIFCYCVFGSNAVREPLPLVVVFYSFDYWCTYIGIILLCCVILGIMQYNPFVNNFIQIFYTRTNALPLSI